MKKLRLALLLVAGLFVASVTTAYAVVVTGDRTMGISVPTGETHTNIFMDVTDCSNGFSVELRFNKPRLEDGRFDQSVDWALSLTDPIGGQYISDSNSNRELWVITPEMCIEGRWQVLPTNQSAPNPNAVLRFDM